MALGPRLLAATAGLAISFVLVMVIQVLAPDPGLESGRVEVVLERFQFDDARTTVTEGSTVVFVNAAPVPVTLFIEAPTGENQTREVAPGLSYELRLTEKGTYAVSSPSWPWAEADLVVRTDNPFTRYFEDLF